MNGDYRDNYEPAPLIIRGAKRSSAKPIIGLYSKSNGGKTYSALLLARGFAGPKGKVGMIETEAGRGEAYADLPEFSPGYEVIPLSAPFSPKRYGEAISMAEAAKWDAMIIDSASHEWEGIGGVLDWAATNQADGKRSMLAWQQPKISHNKDFMLRLLQSPIPLVIVCMRAKFPMEEAIVDGKKQWARSTVLEPTQAEDILHELFIHGYFTPKHEFVATRYTRPDLKEVIRDGEMITLESGQRLAAWSRGETAHQSAPKGRTSLLDGNGAALSVHGTAGEWVQALRDVILAATTAETINQIWDANSDQFNRILDRAKAANPDFLPTINAVGKIRLDRLNELSPTT